MKQLKGLMAAMVLGVAAIAAPASAATLVTSGGKLTGATGVMVGSKSYDVSFVDGTCGSVFGACTTSNFTFTTAATALAAGQALLSQVFLNASAGSYDSKPNLTAGCSSALVCNVLIPYAAGRTTELVVDTVNSSINVLDGTVLLPFGTGTSTSGLSSFVYAKFAESAVTSVPETATWGMMLIGFGMMGATLRTRRRDAKVAVA